MKATVLVRLKTEVLDPQGDAVRRALGKLGFEGVKDVRVGKLIEIEIDDAARRRRTSKQRLAKMADEMLANPVIEDYESQASERARRASHRDRRRHEEQREERAASGPRRRAARGRAASAPVGG